MKCPNRGVYAITQTDGKTVATVVDEVVAVLNNGAVIVQYRDKTPMAGKILARELLAVCRQYHTPLVINDNVRLAAEIGADGVHLGRDDGDLQEARAVLGAAAIIGVSCYNSLERAQQAQTQGADYVAFGRFFPSSSKPLAHLPVSKRSRLQSNN